MCSDISTAADFVMRINRQASKAVVEILRTGAILNEAKSQLAHGTFERMFEDHPDRMDQYIRMSARYARTFMKIAASNAIKNNSEKLAPNVKVLAELSRLPEEEANELISSGAITKATSAKCAKATIAKRNPSSDFKTTSDPQEKNRNPSESKSEPEVEFTKAVQLPKPIAKRLNDISELLEKAIKNDKFDAASAEGKLDILINQLKDPSSVTCESIDISTFPKTWKEKYDIALRKALREFQNKFDEAVSFRSKELIDAHMLPAWKRKIDYAETMQRNYQPDTRALTPDEYKKILICLHPDRVTDEGLKVQYTDAFNIFKGKKMKLVLLEPPTEQSPPLPSLFDEIIKMNK
jgi:hypothetical protein